MLYTVHSSKYKFKAFKEPQNPPSGNQHYDTSMYFSKLLCVFICEFSQNDTFLCLFFLLRNVCVHLFMLIKISPVNRVFQATPSSELCRGLNLPFHGTDTSLAPLTLPSGATEWRQSTSFYCIYHISAPGETENPVSSSGSSEPLDTVPICIPDLNPTARAAFIHSPDSLWRIILGPGSVPFAKDIDEQDCFLAFRCSELGGEEELENNGAVWVGAGSCRGTLYLVSWVALGSAFTESAVCAHQTVCCLSRKLSHSALCARCSRTIPDLRCLLNEPSVCFVLICTRNPHS